MCGYIYFQVLTLLFISITENVFAWEKFPLSNDLPETWPEMDILPSFSPLPVPDDLKIPCREAFKPDAMTGKRPSTTRKNN